MRKWLHNLIPFFVGAMLVAAAGTLANDDEPKVRSWPEELWATTIRTADRLGVSISNVLFDALDEVTLYSITGGPDDKIRGSYRVERSVFDNFDLLNTYTVIDRARIKMSAAPLKQWASTLDESLTTPTYGMPYAGVIFSPQASMEWMNIRQVQANRYRQEPTMRSMREQLEEELARDPELPPPETNPNLTELNPYARWYIFDPSQRPRFAKAWNLVTFPFRLPLSARSLKRMKDGEMISYSFTGSVELGGRVGWKIIPDPQAQAAGIDFSVSAVVEGTYRILVQKEDERYAKVKLTRVGKWGRRAGATVGYKHEDIFKGFLLFRGSSVEMDNLGAFDLKVVPFEWETKRMNGEQFDVSYRYDLTNDEARDAYHRAVLGSFVSSDHIASRGRGAPVTLEIRRQAKLDERRGTHELGVSFLVKHERGKKLDGIEATITLPDGERRVFRSFSENTREWTALFGAIREKVSRKFTVVLDQDAYEQNKPDSLFVIAEAFSEDLHTRGKEINRTINEIERFFGRPEMFPEMPVDVVDSENPNRKRRAWYGKSSFYWGFHIGRRQIEKFLDVPIERRAEIAGQVFPSDDVQTIVNRWNEASLYRAGQPRELYGALKKLFNDRKRGRALMHLIRVALKDESLDYFVDAQNSGFPAVHERGKMTSSVETLLNNTDQQPEVVARRPRDDTEAKVTNLRYFETPDGLVKIRFHLAQQPLNVRLTMTRVTGYKPYLILAELQWNNQDGRFKQGENEILLDPASRDRTIWKLSSQLSVPNQYRFTVGYSRMEGKNGPPVSVDFWATPGYEDEEEENREDASGTTGRRRR